MLRLRETQPSAQRSGSPGWQRSEGRGSAPFSRRSELSRRRDGSNGLFRSLGSRRRSARRHPLRPPKNRYRSTRSRTTATSPGAAAEHDVGRPYERNDPGGGSTPRGAASIVAAGVSLGERLAGSRSRAGTPSRRRYVRVAVRPSVAPMHERMPRAGSEVLQPPSPRAWRREPQGQVARPERINPATLGGDRAESFKRLRTREGPRRPEHVRLRRCLHG